MPYRDEYDEEHAEDPALEVEPQLGASTREVYFGYGSWARARAVIQSTRRAASDRAGPPASQRRAPRRS